MRVLDETAETSVGAARDGGITVRVVVLSLVLAALCGVAIPYNDYKFGNTYLGAAHLPPGAVAVLVVLLLLHGVLRLVARHGGPRLALSRNETLTVYVTCLFSVLVAGRAGENFFVSNLLGPFYFATRENKWLEFLQPHLKPWFTPALSSSGTYNTKVVEDWYTGLRGDAPIPWDVWLVPLAAWAALIIALYVMLACLSVMLRAQWAEHEALSFPLLRLPLEMTEHLDQGGSQGGSHFFRNPTMWLGFAIAVFIQGANGLNLYFPDVPVVPLQVSTGPLFTEAPWNQMGPFTLRVLPIALGISYLLTSEVALSFWFFYLFHKFEMVAAYYLGFMPNSLPDPVWTRGFSKAFISYQNIGAYFAYAAILLWIGREHFTHILRRALPLGRHRAAPRPAEKHEALSYPVAFWGFVTSSAFLVLWTAAAGVRLEIAAIMWFTYVVIALALTRVVVEGGLLYVNHGWSPLLPLAHLVGAGTGAWLSPASGVPASIMQGALMIDLKSFLLPSFLHGFKIAHDRKIPMRPLLALIFAVILVAFTFAVWTNVRLGYLYGGLQLQNWFARTGPQDAARNAKEIMDGVQDTYLLNWFWFAVGALVTYGTMLARNLFSWFPLHPIGYIMWSPYVMYAMWFSIFLGWLFKVLIMRFGGTEAYRRVLPAFLGLALGDVVMMVAWAGIDAWQGRIGHQLMPG